MYFPARVRARDVPVPVPEMILTEAHTQAQKHTPLEHVHLNCYVNSLFFLSWISVK